MGQWQEKMQYGHWTELWLQQTRRKLDFMHNLLFHLVLIGPPSKEAMMLLWVSLEQCQLRTFCPTVLVYSHPSKWPSGPLRKDGGITAVCTCQSVAGPFLQPPLVSGIQVSKLTQSGNWQRS